MLLPAQSFVVQFLTIVYEVLVLSPIYVSLKITVELESQLSFAESIGATGILS